MIHPDIEQLKEKHGVLFSLEIEGTLFVFKQLSLIENSITEGVEVSPELEDYILDKGIVHPRPIPEMKTGMYTNLATAILKISGWREEEVFLQILEDKRHDVRSTHPEAKALICQYLNVDPAYVNSLNIEKFLEHVAEVEVITGKRIYNTKKQRTRERLSPQRHVAPLQPAGELKSWQQLQTMGVGPSFDTLARAIQDETGNVPVSLEEALDRKSQRPKENLPKPDIDKIVITKDDDSESPTSNWAPIG